MNRPNLPRRRLGLATPAPAVVAASLAAASLALAVNQSALASIAIFDGKPPSIGNGLAALAVASLKSIAIVTVTLTAALLAIVALLSVLLGRPRLASAVRTVFNGLSNLPILFLLPLWLILAGNSEAASVGFLLFCFFYLLGFVVFSDRGGAKTAEQIAQGFGLRSWRRFFLALEVVASSMRTSVFQVLVLGLPLALAAEMISNREGLGYLASNAFQNGNFKQMEVTVAAYLIAFCVLWFVWSSALAIPRIARAVRGG